MIIIYWVLCGENQLIKINMQIFISECLKSVLKFGNIVDEIIYYDVSMLCYMYRFQFNFIKCFLLSYFYKYGKLGIKVLGVFNFFKVRQKELGLF